MSETAETTERDVDGLARQMGAKADKFRARVETWSLNGDTARVTVNLGQARAILADSDALKARVGALEAAIKEIEAMARMNGRVPGIVETARAALKPEA